MKRHWCVKSLAAAFMLAASALLASAAGGDPWEAFDKAEKDMRGLEAELRLCNAAIEACRDVAAAMRTSELAPLRKAVEEAEKAAADAGTQTGLNAARDKLQAARTARDAKVESLLASSPTFKAAREKRDALKKKIDDISGRIGKLSAEEVLELVRLRGEERDIGKHIDGSIRAMWTRGEVAAEFKAADEAYKAMGAVSARADAVKQANEKVRAAQKALSDAIADLPLGGTPAEKFTAQRKDLEAKIADLKTVIDGLEKNLVGAGKTVSIAIKEIDRKTKNEVDSNVSLWIPPNCEYIRGVIIAHPMISGLATARPMRIAAAREGLASMVFGAIPGEGNAAIAKFDEMFEKFAAASGHPELKGAPVLLGGLSASVLATRNVACAVPERVFGIVHAAGGNMHQMPDDGRGMVQVPFFAHNGEFEWCGPEGGGHMSGKAGIRAEYGNQTQWVMIREQMLRLWRDRHEHRMSLLVVPNADHGAWDVGLTAMFVRKAAQYRLPKEKRDGSKPAVCTPLPVSKGWLTDADLDHPQYPPAPYESYKGDKNNAFWHLDEEMATVVCEYHKGRFILPDPTKTSPVPSDWPPKRQ
jgi:hypothetical protein